MMMIVAQAPSIVILTISIMEALLATIFFSGFALEVIIRPVKEVCGCRSTLFNRIKDGTFPRGRTTICNRRLWSESTVKVYVEERRSTKKQIRQASY